MAFTALVIACGGVSSAGISTGFSGMAGLAPLTGGKQLSNIFVATVRSTS